MAQDRLCFGLNRVPSDVIAYASLLSTFYNKGFRNAERQSAYERQPRLLVKSCGSASGLLKLPNLSRPRCSYQVKGQLFSKGRGFQLFVLGTIGTKVLFLSNGPTCWRESCHARIKTVNLDSCPC